MKNVRSGSRLIFVDVQASEAALPFYIPPAMNDSSCGYIFSPAFGVVSVSDFWHSNRYMQMYLVVWICSSLLTYTVEHLFICLCTICTSSGEVFRSFAHIKLGRLLLILSVLCIFWVAVLYLCCAKIFSQFVACLFVFLTVFHKAKVFNFNKI